MSGDTSRHDILISVSISGPHRYSGATLRGSLLCEIRLRLSDSEELFTHQTSLLICSFTAAGFPFEGLPAPASQAERHVGKGYMYAY